MSRLTVEDTITAVRRRPGLTVADLAVTGSTGFVAAMLQGAVYRGLIDGRVELDAEWHFYPVTSRRARD